MLHFNYHSVDMPMKTTKAFKTWLRPAPIADPIKIAQLTTAKFYLGRITLISSRLHHRFIICAQWSIHDILFMLQMRHPIAYFDLKNM